MDAACLGTRSFFLVSSDSASVQRETKHRLVAPLLHAEAMQKDQHEVYYVLSQAQKRRQEELHSLQHTSDTWPTSSLLMKRDRGPKEVSLTEMRPDIAREKIKFPNPHGKITFTQENKSKAEYKQENE